MPRTIQAALLVALSTAPAAAAPPAAELRALGTAGAEMRARIEEAQNGYRYTIHCETGCPGPVEHTEDAPLVPLGLFQIWDGDGLLISTWAAASVYIVRVHLLTPQAIRPVLDEPSRGAPAFALDASGRMTVTTTERLAGPRDGVRRVVWRWDGMRFHRRPG